jgi:hypothetical protein
MRTSEEMKNLPMEKIMKMIYKMSRNTDKLEKQVKPIIMMSQILLDGSIKDLLDSVSKKANIDDGYHKAFIFIIICLDCEMFKEDDRAYCALDMIEIIENTKKKAPYDKWNWK